jgi:hypothetical protein
MVDKMNKKTLLLPIMMIILLGTIIPQTTATETQSTGIFDEFRLIQTNTTTEISLDSAGTPSNPVDLNETLNIDVNVGLTGELPLLFPQFLVGTKIGNWIMFRDENQNSTVNVTLSVESPDWCTAELVNNKIELDLMSDSKESTKLKVTIKETALALKTGEIKVKAKFNPSSNWMFKPSEDTADFNITSKYVGNITAVIEPLQGVDEYIVEPGVNTTLPLNITNNFNGETRVKIDFNDDSSEINWTVSLDREEINIPKGGTETVNIIIKPSSAKKEQVMQITFELTPTSTEDIDIDDQHKVGETIEVFTGPILKEKIEDEFPIDTNMLILLIVVLVILIILALIIKKKKA